MKIYKVVYGIIGESGRYNGEKVEKLFLNYNKALALLEEKRDNSYCFHPHIEEVEVIE